MRRKLFTLMAALMLVLTTSVAPMKVAAQGPVEYLTLIVVGLGENEMAEIYYWRLRDLLQGQSQGSDAIKVGFLYNATRVFPPGSSSDGPCTETVQSTVEAYPGFNSLNIQMGPGNESLLINGEVVPLSESCLIDADRVAIRAGVPFPPSMVGRLAADPNTVPTGFSKLDIVGFSIVDSNYATVASASLGVQPGVYTVTEVVPD